MDPIKANKLLDLLEDYTESKQSYKFKKAFGQINNKLQGLKKRNPNSIEYDYLKDALIDIKDFYDYSFNKIFEVIDEMNALQLNLSNILDEKSKYAKLLAAMGVHPMLYYTISDETLDFIIEYSDQIGMINVEELVDIDLAYTICKTAFKSQPRDYNHLRKMFLFTVKQNKHDRSTGNTRVHKKKLRTHEGVPQLGRKRRRTK